MAHPPHSDPKHTEIREPTITWERQQLAQWVRNWARTGDKLEGIRAHELRAMDDEEAHRAMREVFSLWRYPEALPQTSGLMELRHWFGIWQRNMESSRQRDSCVKD